MNERPDKPVSIDVLIHRLSSVDTGPAWAEFINRYSALIMKIVRQFEYAQERHSECFLFVCEKLSDRQFRRLRKFNVTGKASFKNWLATVVFNLCVDWHRTEFGRATVTPAISALPAFDQLVYVHCYESGMSRDTCYQTIKADFPELAVSQVTASLERIHALLSPRQRWQLGLRNHRRAGNSDASLSATEYIQDPGPEPDVKAQVEEENNALQTALSLMPSEQRLLLYLRYQEGLTFQRIAQMERLGDAHRARRYVQKALDALFILLKKTKSYKKRQN